MIKNLIFDLGGVILDIDQERCERAFADLGGDHIIDNISKYGGKGVFGSYERGEIDTPSFLNGLKEIIGKEVSEDELAQAWKKIIVAMPTNRLQFLEQCRKKYNVYLLSNTSPLHTEEFERMALEQLGKPFESLFDKVYYSYQVGISKPDAEIYQHVLSDAELNADETVFIDDSELNLEGARKLGIHTIHIPHGEELLNIMSAIPEKSPNFVNAI